MRKMKRVELRQRLVEASLPQGGEYIIMLPESFKLVNDTAIKL